jgi:hypothetical protein
MLAFKGPAQPSPTLGDALNAGYCYLEVKCLGCDTHQTIPLDTVRRPKSTPHPRAAGSAPSFRATRSSATIFVALRATKISTEDPPSH